MHAAGVRGGEGCRGRARGRRCQARLLLALPLLLLLPAHLPAQTWEDFDYEDLEFRGIGVEGGVVWPARVEPTRALGVRVDLGFLGPRVRVSPTARFWSSTLRAEEVGRLAEQILLVCERQVDATCPQHLDLGEVRFSDLELAAEAQYLALPDLAVSPYLGLGIGLHLLNGAGDFIDGTFVEDLLDTLAPGLAAVSGVDVILGRAFRLGAEARFVLATDVRYASVSAGGVWTLPTRAAGDLMIWRRGRVR